MAEDLAKQSQEKKAFSLSEIKWQRFGKDNILFAKMT